MNKMQEAQIVDVRVTRNVSVPKDYVENSKVDEKLRNDNRLNATFSEFIANTKLLAENKYEWVWVADDKLAPKESGYYEVIRNKDPDGFIRVSVKKASDERWAELAKTPENRLYVSEAAANRSGCRAVGVFYGRDGLDLVADWGPDGAARVAEAMPQGVGKVATELVEAARKSVAKLDAAVNAGVLKAEVVEPLKDLVRASE